LVWTRFSELDGLGGSTVLRQKIRRIYMTALVSNLQF
jgi:hypothetical protein